MSEVSECSILDTLNFRGLYIDALEVARAVMPVCALPVPWVCTHPTVVQNFKPSNGGSLAMDFLIPFCRIAVSEQHTANSDCSHEKKFLIALATAIHATYFRRRSKRKVCY